ncbi:MAG: sensor domain-containing protein, partial [Marmoricola sp.]
MATSPSWFRQLGRDSGYALTILPLVVPAFVLVVTLVAVGFGLSILVIGLPIMALGILTARAFASLERRRLSRLTATAMVHPAYLVPDPADGFLRRVTLPARDRQSWLDVVWVVVALFTGTLSWAIAVAWWSSALGGTTYAVWQWFIPRGTDPVTLASLLGFGDTRGADILVISSIGVFALVTLPLAMRVAALM